LEFKDWVEIELKDKEGIPFANEDYILILPDGSELQGTLDEEGRTLVENICPGPITFKIKKSGNQ
jgi:tRNA A37 threonylcarbamoyladenosine synthetase subunit TsaC/SUA5/YrdC